MLSGFAHELHGFLRLTNAEFASANAVRSRRRLSPLKHKCFMLKPFDYGKGQ